jgi:hypothetical protein
VVFLAARPGGPGRLGQIVTSRELHPGAILAAAPGQPGICKFRCTCMSKGKGTFGTNV